MRARVLPWAFSTYFKYAYIGLQSVLVQAFNPTPPRYDSKRQQTLVVPLELFVENGRDIALRRDRASCHAALPAAQIGLGKL